MSIADSVPNNREQYGVNRKRFFPDTHVPVKTLFEYLLSDRTICDFVNDHSTVSHAVVVAILEQILYHIDLGDILGGMTRPQLGPPDPQAERERIERGLKALEHIRESSKNITATVDDSREGIYGGDWRG